ncbi:DUF4832 domain-containing protein [Autumnicola musiva]|uniref:DUF4832 domain-containing protein n=1 Tax=Autumnicola musiva TaxID=3075589 RepID=A0ABU3DAI5_9FLAO|nr:DUF4832 domain-containing protein [Zunongwangia sp. F117]MDT0678556.1 DUF4832 domain-containing protein [Zunongwangia sp. F117]
MKTLVTLLTLLLFMSCNENEGKEVQESTTPTTSKNEITFEKSSMDFVNPERGFYRASRVSSNNYEVLSAENLKNYREETTSNGSSYRTYNSLVFRYFVLEDFVDQPISQDYLDSMQDDFDAAREAGVKLIPRFAYTVSPRSGDCPEGSFCPPYGDASKEIILQHIDQVGPILSANADVIFTIQMGFIGIWGEQYYTDHFGDASSNGNQGKLTDENWEDRIEVLKALLDAVPKEIMVQVRYPQIKQRAVYGIDAETSSAPLTKDEAFSGSDKARIGIHNDCLFASADDFGTYKDYGNSNTPASMDIETLKTYFAEDSKWVVIGGETCSDGYSPENDCAPGGMADEDLRKLHYTYLNADYNNEVNNDWVDGGCMDDIKKNLGYRLVLQRAVIPETISISEQFDIELDFKNVGYASPVKERPVFLVLKNISTQKEIRLPLETDIRFWTNEINLEQSFDLKEVEAGEYTVHIFLPDSNSSIAERPEYAIRLANKDVWDEETGYNDLNLTLTLND